MTSLPPGLRASQRFLEAVHESTDPTPYSRRIQNALHEMGISLDKNTDIERLRQTIDRTIASPDARVMEHLRGGRSNGTDNVDIMVDPVTRDFIEGHGCSVPGVLMMYGLAQDATLVCDGVEMDLEMMRMRNGISYLDLSIELSPTVLWRPGRVRLLEGMPATYAVTVVNRRMAEVVSHPLIDRHGMTIVGWDGVDLDVEQDEDDTPVMPRTGKGAGRR